jgi:hypothetical protein
MAGAVAKEVLWLKCNLSGYMETGGLAFLGRHYGNKEILLPFWFIFH